jgi:hypothetical protein
MLKAASPLAKGLKESRNRIRATVTEAMKRHPERVSALSVTPLIPDRLRESRSKVQKILRAANAM